LMCMFAVVLSSRQLDQMSVNQCAIGSGGDIMRDGAKVGDFFWTRGWRVGVWACVSVSRSGLPFLIGRLCRI